MLIVPFVAFTLNQISPSTSVRAAPAEPSWLMSPATPVGAVPLTLAYTGVWAVNDPDAVV